MQAAESTYLYALCATSTTFVGFSALIMLIRQSMGGGVSELEAWITRTFVQLGFKVTAGALSPAALALCHVRAIIIWCLCSVVLAADLFLFVVTYPSRRRTVARASAPLFVYVDLCLLLGACSVLASNAAGWSLEPNAGLYAKSFACTRPSMVGFSHPCLRQIPNSLMNDSDSVFRALADPSRRKLLDALYAHDAQTLTELCEHLEMTRQAVTQHLNVLESANLVATSWRGREKLHFLNPVPLQHIYDRWIRKFERPRLKALHDLKKRLEGA